MSPPSPVVPRVVEVRPERLQGWVAGFADRHDGVHHVAVPIGDAGGSAPQGTSERRALLLVAGDEARALILPWGSRPSSDLAEVEPKELTGGRPDVSAWATPPSALALVLLRRGGYAVGMARGPELVRHRCGTRYVQSRTAAGGWSQQRFARRRGNQADALVGAVATHVGDVVDAPVDALVVGGDKALVRQLLQDDGLATLARLPRRELYDLPDPRLQVLRDALRRARAVRLLLREPPRAGAPVPT